MTSNDEPKCLRQGKELHKKIQKEWRKDANAYTERTITKPSGQKGRMDILVNCDETLCAVVEIKGSDWNIMSLSNLRRNVKRQARQIWNYIESQLEEGIDVSPGVIFPKQPKDIDRMKLVEHLFKKRGISVVWEDETIDERAARSQMDNARKKVDHEI